MLAVKPNEKMTGGISANPFTLPGKMYYTGYTLEDWEEKL